MAVKSGGPRLDDAEKASEFYIYIILLLSVQSLLLYMLE
jgi:hypothetical protein